MGIVLKQRDAHRRYVAVHHRRQGIGLFLRYGLVSLVPVMLLGLAVLVYTRFEHRRTLIDQAEHRAQTLLDGGIEPAVAAGRTGDGTLTDDARRTLRQSSAVMRERGGVNHLKIWTTTGRLIFDADGPLPGGRRPAPDDGFLGAAAGDMGWQLRLEDGSAGQLQIVAPLRDSGGETVVAVAGFSVDLDHQGSPVSLNRLRTVLLSVLGLLWLLLGLVTLSVTTSLRRNHAEHRQMALFDPLTGLPNRRHFTDEASRTLAALGDVDEPAAVVLLDLVGFTQINSALGRAHGDELLRFVSSQLSAIVQPGQLVARLGGDVFGLLLPGVDSAGAMKLLGVFRAALEVETEVAGIPVSFEAAIGVASYPADGTDVATVLQRADIAMEAAKASHVDARSFSTELDRSDPARLGLAVELRRAMTKHELYLVYQPKVHLEDMSVRSVEALIRWNHPERGMVSPAEFIPVAEATGLIVPLTAWVLDEASRQAASWARDGLPLRVAINVSAKNVRDDRFPEHVMRCLDRHSLATELVELEITETAIVNDPARVARTVRRLKEAGVAVALDDFGQGATSLAHLRNLSLHTLKIDKCFIDDLCVDPVDAAIVRSMIGLGHQLGLEVVAEGVENAEQYATLTAWGCDVVQGFYFSRPLTVDQLAVRFDVDCPALAVDVDGHGVPTARPVGSDGGHLLGLGRAGAVGGAAP